MDEHAEALVRKRLAEQSDNGRNMEDIRWSNRDEIAYWLRQHYNRPMDLPRFHGRLVLGVDGV